MRRINVVYTLIMNENKRKVLMVKNKDNDSWTLPGGSVEGNETLESAAKREAKEETGLDIEVYGIVSVNEAIIESAEVQAIFFTFRAEIVGGTQEIIRPEEISDIKWIDLDKSDDLMPYYKDGISSIVRLGDEIIYFDEGRVS